MSNHKNQEKNYPRKKLVASFCIKMQNIDEVKSIDSPSDWNTNRKAQIWRKCYMQRTFPPHWNNGKLVRKHSDFPQVKATSVTSAF